MPPSTIWPSAPMLNSPARNASAMPSAGKEQRGRLQQRLGEFRFVPERAVEERGEAVERD